MSPTRSFAYYPGCTAKGTTREADLATRWLARSVGLVLEELVDAGCCGSCEIKAVNPTLHFMLNARILSLAAAQDREIVTICDTCQANLLETRRRLDDESSREALIDKLDRAGISYGRSPRVRHIARVLLEEIGVDALRRHVTRSLRGLRVAPFACCHSFRGPGATTGSRLILDELVAVCGAGAARIRTDSDCCGFHVLMVKEDSAARASGRFLVRCADAGADCVVTTSPLCHAALDIYQRNAERAVGRRIGMPVLHIEQLLGLALGASPVELGLDRHMVSTRPVLDKLDAAQAQPAAI